MDDQQNTPPPLPTPVKEAVAPKRVRSFALPVVLCLLAMAAVGGFLAYKYLPSLSTTGQPGIYTLAVGTIADNGGKTPENVTNIINDVFYSSLDETKKFKLVERSRMADIMKEFVRTQPDAPRDDSSYGKVSSKDSVEKNMEVVANNILQNSNKALIEKGQGSVQLGDMLKVENGHVVDLAVSSRLDPDQLLKIRTLTKADYFLVGVVSDFYSEQAEKTNTVVGHTSRRSALSMTLDARIINTATGEIVTAPTVCVEEPRIASTPGNSIADRLQKLEIETARKTARKFALGVVNSLYPISVSEVSNGKIYLNRGTLLGIETGDVFTVLSQGKDIIDPDTKKSIGKVEEEVGEIMVTQALDKMSIATLVSEGAVVKKDMICRPSQSNAKAKDKEKGGQAAAEEPTPKPVDDGRMSIAIMPLRNSASAEAKAIDDLQTYFYTEMGQFPDVRLIERQQLEKVGQELSLGDDGYVSPETAIQVGKLTGAKYCLIGSLTRLTNDATESALRPDLRKTINRTSIEMDCRFLDTEKGEIYKQPATATKVTENDKPAAEVAAATMRDAVKELCQRLMGVAAPAQATPAPAPSAPVPTPAATPAAAPAVPAAPASNVEPVAGQFLTIGSFANTVDGKAPNTIIDALGSALETSVQQTKRIPVVERLDSSYLDEVVFQKEGKGFLDLSTLTDPKIKGAKYYLANRIVSYTAGGGSSKDALIPNVYHYHWSVAMEIQAKIIDIQTSQLVEVFQIKKEVSGGADAGGAVSGVPELEAQHSKLAQQIAEELTAGIIRVCCPLLVAAVTADDIYLNQGESMGVHANDTYAVYNVGQDIIDPQTGKVLGKEEVLAGNIQVMRTEREMAIAKPVGENSAPISSFTKGMICKRVELKDGKAKQNSAQAAKAPVAAGTAAPAAKPADAPPPAAKPVDAGIPQGMERVFALAPVANTANSPNRALAAFRDGVSKGIQTAANTKVVTRDDAQLAQIGKEYLSGKSGFMDDSTRLKTLRLAGCRYMVFMEVTDWISQVSTKQIPMTNQSIDIQEVQMRASGTVVDLKTGQVLCSAQAKASSVEDVDSAVTVDQQGDLDMDAKIAEKTAQRMVEEFRKQGALK